MVAWIIGGLVVYAVGSYYFIGRDLIKSPGPAGLGILAIPFAPLLLPMAIGYGIWEVSKKVVQRVFR
ncbi:MAG TPA: hypothetical protein VM577_18650 [Anaerovoracaceae bacterium]|nr:hypothetical protein [Anaerovoracaceae bacterium]